MGISFETKKVVLTDYKNIGTCGRIFWKNADANVFIVKTYRECHGKRESVYNFPFAIPRRDILFHNRFCLKKVCVLSNFILELSI